MEEEKVVQTEEGTFNVEVPDTIELPVIENPDDREYENVEIECEGGL